MQCAHAAFDPPTPCGCAQDVAALRGGSAALPADAAMVLGLFCRLYSHLLLALDDTDFHARQQRLGVDAARAIATCLNSLVFHTYFPEPEAAGIEGRISGAGVRSIDSSGGGPRSSDVAFSVTQGTRQRGKVRIAGSGTHLPIPASDGCVLLS